MAQQLLAAHVTGSACDRSTGIGAGTTQVDVVQLAKTIEVRRWIIGIGSIKICLATNKHSVIEVAAGKMEKLLQIFWRQ